MAVCHSSVGAVQGKECNSYPENILKLILMIMFVVKHMRTKYYAFSAQCPYLAGIADSSKSKELIQALQLQRKGFGHKLWYYICIYNLDPTQYFIIESQKGFGWKGPLNII